MNMTSGFSGDFFYTGGGGGGGQGRPSMAGIGGNQGGLSPYLFRQQQQQQPQQQGVFSADQIAQRRADLLMGKRSFGDFQYQPQIHLLQQQQQQQPFALLQRQQQQQQQQQQNQPLPLLLQQQYLMRSVKQRTNSFSSSPISPLTPSVDLCSPNNNSLSSVARFGGPVYQQLRSQQQQQQQQPQPPGSLLNNPNQLQSTNNNSLFQAAGTSNTTFANNLLNPVQTNNQTFSSVGYSNMGSSMIQPKPEPAQMPEIGYSNMVTNPVQPKPEPEEDHKILNTLQELEKQLLYDDENQEEGDAVSVITNSEWSETFQNLMGPDPSPAQSPTPTPTPNAVPGSSSTSGSNNNVTTPNNMISPSPTSSTSSCCSTSASPIATPSISAKQMIVEAATAISDGKIEASIEILGRLAQVANPKGNSEQRLAYYMCNALRSRACPSENPPPVLELYGKEQMSAMYLLYELSPCFKFGLLTANLVLLEAITSALQEGLRIHVVGFDVGHGAQYANLLRALADRRGSGTKTELRVTIVETELGNGGGGVEQVKDGLMKLAERVGIDLKLECVTQKIHELSRESLGCEEGEAVVVNFAFKLYQVPDESVSMENLRDELLRRVKGLRPRAVTLVEQDMNGNTAPFMTRVNEALEKYGALLESLESSLPKDNSDRTRAEEALGRKMANTVACEGRERVERCEVFGKWRARMGMAGLEQKALSESVAESMRTKLKSARGGNPGFMVKEVNGGIGFGWMGKTLTVASAWR